jgi:thioredoxin 1
MSKMIEINGASFEAEVLQAAQPVVVDFSSPECGPCKMLAPVLNEIAAEQAGRVKVVKVDIYENMELANRYGVRGAPTLLYFMNGEVRNQTLGLTSKKKIVSNLAELTALA